MAKAVACALGAFTLAEAACDLKDVFADMHDGDRKMVEIRGTSMVITPAGSDKWEVDTTIDCEKGEAMVDFNVPGKDDHPPVPLKATQWSASSVSKSQTIFEFSDPSGTVSWVDYPLNHWAQVQGFGTGQAKCPTQLRAVFADMADGDRKTVVISGTSMTITPANDEKWTVQATLNDACEALVDFRVDGKPNPPPVALSATFFEATNQGASKVFFEFSDPSGTISYKDYPLNHWVEIPQEVATV